MRTTGDGLAHGMRMWWRELMVWSQEHWAGLVVLMIVELELLALLFAGFFFLAGGL